MFIDEKAGEINVKVVYHGPGLGGKTSCLQYVFSKTRPYVRSQMVSVASETERSLFFSFLPLTLPAIAGRRVRVWLFTVSGPVFYDSSRRLILKGADAVMFVADSQEERLEANVESLESLENMLATNLAYRQPIPRVFSYNKRDLPNAAPVAELEAALNLCGVHPSAATIAAHGVGVFEALKTLIRPVLVVVRRELGDAEPAG